MLPSTWVIPPWGQGGATPHELGSSGSPDPELYGQGQETLSYPMRFSCSCPIHWACFVIATFMGFIIADRQGAAHESANYNLPNQTATAGKTRQNKKQKITRDQLKSLPSYLIFPRSTGLRNPLNISNTLLSSSTFKR
jgi:hypothetical protein